MGGRSATQAVSEIVDSAVEGFEESLALSLLDLSKAFDCVLFDILQQKLSFHGVSDQYFQLTGSYLMNW